MKLACLLLTLILVTILSGSGSATVNILVSTYDGLVIAADSRVTLTDSGLVRIASDTYQKVFQVGTYTGVSSSGAAFLINPSGQLRSIGSILNEFAAAKGISDTSRVYPQVFAEDLRGHLLTLFRTEQANLLQGEVDLLVFGYDQDSRRRIFDIVVPILKRTSDGQPVIEAEMTESFASGAPGSIIRGQQDVYFRLIKGYDPSLMQVAYFDSIKSHLDQLRYDIRYDLMSLQDAVDFAVFIVRATIEAQRFNQGSLMGVGGAIDVAVVTPDGFRWLQKKGISVEGRPVER